MAINKKLKRYRVHGKVVGSKFLGEFEATSKDKAEEMAMESKAAYVSLCHQCICECEDPEVTEACSEEIK